MALVVPYDPLISVTTLCDLSGGIYVALVWGNGTWL